MFIFLFIFFIFCLNNRSVNENLIVVACWFEDNIILIDLNNEKFLEKISVSGGPRSFGSFILN